jgi:ectoine hydroxylase-related dioxygenase (phytanoyl-CoA dioxygenase family)
MSSCIARSLSEYCYEICERGFAVIGDVVSEREINATIAELDQLSVGQSSRGGQVYAARNLLATVPSVKLLARAPRIRAIVEAVLGKAPFPVRGILFDKVPGANWNVGWHQDQFIAVRERRDVPGFRAWSIKQNIPHVLPPTSVLERMLTLRIHLDDCRAGNGALKVIPGSHNQGLLSDEEIGSLVANSEPTICEALRGSVLAMRPLLLHASSPAASPSHRRVVHIEYAADPLPGGLEWPLTN